MSDVEDSGTYRQWPRRVLRAYGWLLATVATAALIVGALALGDGVDQRKTQVSCAKLTAYASGLQAAQAPSDVTKAQDQFLYKLTAPCER